ncbi:hypothetical protein CUU64_16930 [Bacillus sp. V5-8f]|nr:hypothetical protein CUU64_16930 [Bacillus sp. V5-8f]
MFFKKDENIDRKSVDIACWITFLFWGIILLINGVFETYKKECIFSSFSILIMGLAVFFISEYITRRIRKSQTNK